MNSCCMRFFKTLFLIEKEIFMYYNKSISQKCIPISFIIHHCPRSCGITSSFIKKTRGIPCV